MVTGQMRPDGAQEQKGKFFQQFSIKGHITTIGKTCKILMQNTNLRFSFQVQIRDNLLKEIGHESTLKACLKRELLYISSNHLANNTISNSYYIAPRT